MIAGFIAAKRTDFGVPHAVACRALSVAESATINSRPRQVLGWRTPAEALNEHLRSLQQPGVASTG